MTDITVRPAEVERDAADVAALITAIHPHAVQDAESIAYRWTSATPQQRPLELVAEVGGATVGHGSVSLHPEFDDPTALFRLYVDAEHRGRGVASAMSAPLLEHARAIGATKLQSRVSDARARDIAVAHGFFRTRTERISHVAVADVPPPLPVPEGIRVATVAELGTYKDLYEVDIAVTSDVPADETIQPLPYEDWLTYFANDPRMNTECTVVAFDGETPVALAWLDGKGRQVFSGLTGVRREYRGRGLAKLAKTHSLALAAERGVVDAYTNNDATNAPMLAVNNWLGYRLYLEQDLMTRVLD
ncbi:MAG TPA: GNAT family N-acetyltransferase [Stackebrandtia sp.]|jgi:GNAT superfamily N-acetyltransferase|uniref:GNAT family N-acetyltransferase n=1 Tax=Stackebrandtia sp. TaxID=2023065 RepID=UPI002D3EC478|nr:GNAT family N-acetyltransferase [Stackebrandtia sp.]HZE39785.1 GNAT family N-acetyltransferase [Stackebrandtia sp.]